MLFINTRPVDRAQPLTQCLRQSGLDVVDLPLLELNPRPFTIELSTCYAELFETQIVVAVSPTAVQIGMQYLAEVGISLDQLQHIRWIAVGKRTAQCLFEYGVESDIPEVETSEGMLRLPIFHELQNLKKIAFWRGEGGRQFMMQHCKDRYIQVVNFVLYERKCPKQTHDKFLELTSRLSTYPTPYWNCITSEASWNHWLTLTQSYPEILNHCHYLVLGERLYQLLIHNKNEMQKSFNIIQISNLEPDTILCMLLLLQRKL